MGVEVLRLPDGLREAEFSSPRERRWAAATPRELQGSRVLIAHNSGDTTAADERAIRFSAEQLVRYARGEELKNVVRAPRS